MNEDWALKVIREGNITIGTTTFDIVRQPNGSCDGCCLKGSQCPSKAITICCSHGGNILKLPKTVLNSKLISDSATKVVVYTFLLVQQKTTNKYRQLISLTYIQYQ